MNLQHLNPFNEDFGTLAPIRQQRVERLIIFYWVIALVLGIPFLHDWLWTWSVPQTWSNPWLLTLLLGTLVLSQVLYIMVSHPDGRPIHWGAALIFGVCNGIAETLTFALIFRGGMIIGEWLTGLVVPAAASYGGFVLGLLFFVMYGGAIHGLFWIRLLPPHFHDDPLSLRIRKLRPLSETLLVMGWSLAWWFYGDIWTVVFCHTIIDLTLMLQVRPPLFQPHSAAQPDPEPVLVPVPVAAAPAPALVPVPVVSLDSLPNGRRIYGLNAIVSDDTLHTWSVTTGLLSYGAMALLGYVADQALRARDEETSPNPRD